ncbi:MAG: hypothetical protein M0Z53_05245 [Thermaerobacter sp.]|nr:hypothetical protein [Thermaerobacter sp.]
MNARPSKYFALPFDQVRTASVTTRRNLVSLDNMANPGVDPVPEWDSPGFKELIAAIILARKRGCPVIWSMGAHVIKNGLSRYVIELVRRGIVTHVAGNGASSIHDFELALLGATSEDVSSAIEDGSFGMWEETGRYMNEAIRLGAKRGLGYGASLASYVTANAAQFPYLQDCVFSETARLGIPYTCHISIGTDIIHQHPSVDFSALGIASGIDFETFCASVLALNGGVLLNLGSAVSGPLLFKRALAVAHNVGCWVREFTVANFDIRPLRGTTVAMPGVVYPSPAEEILINLPKRLGGIGYAFHGLHQVTIPNLYAQIVAKWGRDNG